MNEKKDDPGKPGEGENNEGESNVREENEEEVNENEDAQEEINENEDVEGRTDEYEDVEGKTDEYEDVEGQADEYEDVEGKTNENEKDGRRVSEKGPSEAKLRFRQRTVTYDENVSDILRARVASRSSKSLSEPSKVKFTKLFRFAQPVDYLLMGMGVIFSILTGLSSPANAFTFGDLTDAFIEYRPGGEEAVIDAADKFSVENSLIGMALLICSYLSVIFYSMSIRRQIYRIRLLYFQSALRQDIGWYDLHNTGDFATRMSEDLNKLEDGLSEKALHIVHCISGLIGCFIVALTEGWELALISFSSLPIIILSIKLFSFLSSKLSKSELEAYAKAGAVAEEVLSAIRTVVAFNGQNKEIERYDTHISQAKKNNIRRSVFHGLTFGLLWFVLYGSYCLSFWYGVQYVFDGKYTPGEMTVIYFSAVVGLINVLILGPYVDLLTEATAAATTVFMVIDSKSAINPTSEEGKKPISMKGDIEFQDVYFSYPSRPDIAVLKGVSLKISKGETVAFVGSSGCGKSTCIQLIQRFYDPLVGKVLIDGRDIKEYNVRYLRRHIGVVGQEPVLFGASIEDNIRYSKEDASFEEIMAAAEMANAHSFITRLSHGYDTLVGERGAQMSGGQKQRVAIARALVRNPDILLLDEATSALDNESEAIVQKALDKASQGRTTIIVAHRLSTIRQADKIVVFSKGEIVEQGTHDELYEKEGHYYQLVTTQASEQEPEEEEVEDVVGKSKISVPGDRIKQTSSGTPAGAPEGPDEGEEKVRFKEILRMNSPEWKFNTLGIIASIAMGCCSPFSTIVFGSIMGVFVMERQRALDETEYYCRFFFIIGTVMSISNFFQIWCFGIAGEKLTMRLRSMIFASMLRQEMAWYDRKENAVGALCARLSGDTSNTQGATGHAVGLAAQSLANISLAIAFSLYFQWKLGLISLCISPFLFVGNVFLATRLRGGSERLQKILERSSKIAIEAISNIRTVASLGREVPLYEEYKKELKPTNAILLRDAHVKGVIIGLSRSTLFFVYAICICYGGRLIAYESEAYQNIFKVTQTLIIASFFVANAFIYTPNFQKGLVSANKIYHFLRREPEIQDPEKPVVGWRWNAEGDVTYHKIKFAYPSRPRERILNNFSLEVLKGQNVALVGQSGCGKSTLIQLLLRYYDPDDGEVKLDYYNLKDLRLNDLRKQLGIVSQEPVLFDKTIAENIAYGDNDREVSMGEIIDAAEQANIHTFISSLPMGYETRLGAKGTQLSGGQKQRVAIARALIRKPKVLLLDEATSALDTQSEKTVQEALDKAGVGRTCITIAHRLSTIVDADVIVVIQNGKIAEMGTHADLMSEKGFYKQLYALQGKR